MADTSDRNLLFGILAVQLEFIKSDQLIEAANSWMLDKVKSLGDILVDRGVLPADDRQFLEQIVDKHIAKTGSPKESLKRLQDLGSSIQTGVFVERFRSAELPTDEIRVQSTRISLPSNPNESEETLPLRYQFVKDLARGGLGRVSVARDVELERNVALKEILHDKARSPEARDRFVLEAKITGSLEHPGIVPVYGLGASKDGSPYYAMRLIRGKSLHKEIKNLFETERGKKPFTALDQPTVRRLLRGIVDACNAVAYAHSRGVLHRDLKPSNIMLGKYGETLVVDWGLAKVLGDPNDTLLQSEPAVVEARLNDSSLTMMGSVLGSPGYMSPEQAQGRLDLLDVRSDVFCLGACLYSLLTNQPPFQGNSRESTLEAARSHQFTHPREVDSTIPKALEAVCLRAMAKDSSDRYEAASDLADDIDRWIAGEPVVAMVEPVWQRASRWARRNQTLVASTIVLLVVSFIGLVISNRMISGERDLARQERDRANDLKIIADEATADARHERDLAEQLKVEADAANQVAQRNSQSMMDVLDEFVNRLADRRWAAFPQFEKERLAMLESAVEQVEQLCAQSPTDRVLFRRLISLTKRLAHLYRLTGDATKASQQMDRVLDLCEQIPLDHPNDYAVVNDSLAEYIYLLSQIAPSSELDPVIDYATDVCRKRIALTPNSVGARVAMSRALLQETELSLRKQDFELSKIQSQEALSFLEPVLLETQEFELQLYKIYAIQMHGIASLRLDDLLEAEQNLTQAMDLANELLSKFPENNDVIQFRQSICVDVAELAFAKQETDEGMCLLEESLTVFQQLVDDWKDTYDYRRLLCDVQLTLAQKAILRGDLDSARDHHETTLDWLDRKEESDLTPAHSLPLRLRASALALRLGSEENQPKLSSEYSQVRLELEAFDPLDWTLGDVECFLKETQ